MAGKMALMGESGLEGDLADRQGRAAKKDGRAVDAAVDHVAMDGDSGGLAEGRFELGNADAGDGGEIGKRQVVGEVILDETDDGPEAAAGEGEFVASGAGGGAVAVDEPG